MKKWMKYSVAKIVLFKICPLFRNKSLESSSFYMASSVALKEHSWQNNVEDEKLQDTRYKR